jgi:hypothetical protein
MLIRTAFMDPLDLDLDLMLKRAASADEWTRVVHRCAWCQRVVNERGEYAAMVVLDASTVVTDGMCPSCGMRAMADLAVRRGHAQPLAA